jgi:hypothetical protein
METGAENWLDEKDYLSDDDKQLLSRYPNEEKAWSGLTETARKVGKSVHWPDDNTSEEDRQKFNERLNEFQGVPKTPEEYEFDRSIVPERIAYDEEMEKNFRQWMHDSKAPKSLAKQIYENYCKTMLQRHEQIENQAKENEQYLRGKMGDDFDKKIGDGKERVGTIKEGLIRLSKDLGMDYKDEQGNLQSRLIDDLEMVGKNGAAGDKPNLILALDNLLSYRYKEATTHLGETQGEKKTDQVMSDDWYGKVDAGEHEDDNYPSNLNT